MQDQRYDSTRIRRTLLKQGVTETEISNDMDSIPARKYRL